MIQTTTSKDAKDETENQKEANKFVYDDACKWIEYNRRNNKKGKRQRVYPSTVKINFWEREWFLEMPLYIVYRVSRIIFISMWFYFSPFIAMTLQFLLPFVQLVDKTPLGGRG